MIRNVVSILRGKATPMQVFLAGLLGALIGFVPSVSTSGGLLLAYVLLVLVLNANIGVCLLVAGLAKLLSLLAMPLAFSVGRWMLEGPLSGVFETAVNAPVLAWFGLEYYATTGGVVLGLVSGVIVGGLMGKSLASFRGRMARVEEKNEKFTKVSTAWYSRFFLWLVVGKGHGKKTYADLAAQGKGKPIRIVGVVVVALVVGAFFVAPSALSGPYLAGAARGGLEAWNGATVDVDSVELDLAAGKLAVSGLAMADPNALDTDLFRAARLEADVGTEDLLRKKIVIDRLVVVEGATGASRSSPGALVGPPPAPAPPTEEETTGGVLDPGKSLEDYLADAEVWKQRLAQAREWLEALSSDEEGGEGGAAEDEESLRDRLEREVAEKGYASVVARHLLHDAPTLLVREVVAGGVRSEQLDGSLLDVTIRNLSTAPALVPDAPRLTILSQDGRLDVDVGLGGASAAAADNTLRFVLKGVSAETVGGAVRVDGEPALAQGTLDFAIDGQWSGGAVGRLDLPLDVTFHDCVVRLPSGARKVDGLVMPFGLRGRLDDPRVTFDDDALRDAILAGAKAELEAAVDEKKAELEAKLEAEKAEAQARLDAEKAELEQKKDEKLDEAKDKLGDKVDDALGGLFGGDDEDDDKKKKKKKKKDADAADGGG